jgi:hypothetical protein
MNDDAQTRCADFRVRLFLSVDLSGSTAFKNSKVGKGSDGVHPKWVNEFNRFYDRFPKEFQSKYRSAYSLDLGGDEPPRLWKAIGDELIFCGVITSIKSAECAIKAFTGTMFEFRKIYGQEVMPLDLKGAAWIAYFPEPNRTVLVHNGDGNQASEDDPIASEALEKKADHHPHRYDILGSSIDEGFRVGSLASPSMFTFSAQLALLLCDPNGSLPLYYDGGALLKGVVTGIDYPRIYILTTSNMPTEELLIAQRELVGSLGSEKEKLKRYLSEFCKLMVGNAQHFP